MRVGDGAVVLSQGGELGALEVAGDLAGEGDVAFEEVGGELAVGMTVAYAHFTTGDDMRATRGRAHNDQLRREPSR